MRNEYIMIYFHQNNFVFLINDSASGSLVNTSFTERKVYLCTNQL